MPPKFSIPTIKEAIEYINELYKNDTKDLCITDDECSSLFLLTNDITSKIKQLEKQLEAISNKEINVLKRSINESREKLEAMKKAFEKKEKEYQNMNCKEKARNKIMIEKELLIEKEMIYYRMYKEHVKSSEYTLSLSKTKRSRIQKDERDEDIISDSIDKMTVTQQSQ